MSPGHHRVVVHGADWSPVTGPPHRCCAIILRYRDGFWPPISHWSVYGNERHPMKSPIQRQLEIFSAALERSAGPERDAFLAQTCASDDALRQSVENLLANHE